VVDDGVDGDEEVGRKEKGEAIEEENEPSKPEEEGDGEILLAEGEASFL